jgi:hypothetical protein
MMKRLRTAQRGGFGKKKLDIVLGRVGKVVGTKNHRFCFDISKNLIVLNFLKTKNGILL